MPNGPWDRPRRSSGDRGVRFACKPTKLEPPGIHNFDIFDRGGVLFELASSYSVQKARPLYGSGPGSPQGIIDQLT
jgi:hypothetical protein